MTRRPARAVVSRRNPLWNFLRNPLSWLLGLVPLAIALFAVYAMLGLAFFLLPA